MADKKESLEDKIATREHLITDQGNGMSYCSNCRYNLGPSPSKHYDTCPKCEYTLIEGKVYIPSGGSDFP